jgi:hypothetical protein
VLFKLLCFYFHYRPTCMEHASSDLTVHFDVVIVIPVSYLGGPGFSPRPGTRLPYLWVSVVLPNDHTNAGIVPQYRPTLFLSISFPINYSQ